jgi:hypothetical protein
MKRALVGALLIVVAGCGGDRGAFDMGGEDIGPDLHAVESRDGEVKLGLTDRYVYFALSDAALEEARAEVSEDLEGKEGLGGVIGDVVGSAVDKALQMRIKYPIEEIRDIRWEDGEMAILLEDGGRRLDESIMKVDDRPVSEAFDRDAVEEFAAEFRRLKDG